jgi:hypothetical protein
MPPRYRPIRGADGVQPDRRRTCTPHTLHIHVPICSKLCTHPFCLQKHYCMCENFAIVLPFLQCTIPHLLHSASSKPCPKSTAHPGDHSHRSIHIMTFPLPLPTACIQSSHLLTSTLYPSINGTLPPFSIFITRLFNVSAPSTSTTFASCSLLAALNSCFNRIDAARFCNEVARLGAKGRG